MKLNPFRIFTRGGRIYLIDGDRMTVCQINDADKQCIETLTEMTLPKLSEMERERIDRLHLLQSESEDISKSERIPPIPVKAMAMVLTQRCNFRCIYCYGVNNTPDTEKDMTEKTACRAVDWLIENSQQTENVGLTFFGGEPLLRFDLLKRTVEYARTRENNCSKSFRFSVTSNGSLLTEQVLEFATANDIRILISLDGPPDIQNNNRPFANGSESYHIVKGNFRRAVDSGSAIPGCRATITNSTDPAVVQESLRGMGFEKIEMRLETSCTDGGDIGKSEERNWQGMAAMAEREISTILEMIRDRNTSELKRMWKTFSIRDSLERFLRPTKKSFFCGAGRTYVAVTPDGGIYLCHRFAHDTKFRSGSIWSEPACQPQSLAPQTVFQSSCRSCFARHFCGGGCYHDNLMVGGSTGTPAKDMCRIMGRQVESAAYVAAHLSKEDIQYMEEQRLIPPKPWYEDLW